MNRSLAYTGLAAALCCAAAVLISGVLLDGYSHVQHPVALAGAGGVPGALWFNLFGFVAPGLLAAALALGVYAALPATAGWLPRIGARLLLLSALAFAAQGLLPLDLRDLDGAAGGRHAAAWMAWWIAFVPGALLLALGLRGLWTIGAVAALTLSWGGFAPAFLIEPPLMQRLVLAAWLLWLALAPWLAGTGGRPGPAPGSAVAELEREDGGGQAEGDDVGEDHRP